MKCKFELCTRPCQMGKTNDIINNIINRYNNSNRSNNFHLLELVVTNKSLLEVKQWTERLNNKCLKLKTHTISLSSKSKDFRSIEKLISYLTNITSLDNFPNIIIMCFHDTRVCNDIIEIINSFSSDSNLLKVTITFSITFDEPDVNMKTTSKFLEKAKMYISSGKIERISFVTATPEERFWKELGKHSIFELENTNRESSSKFKKELLNYRSIEDHEFHTLDLDSDNPLEYIIEVYATGLIDESKPVIIFSPAHVYKYAPDIGCHKDFETFFLSKGYAVLLINGDFKGFKYPSGKQTTIEDYKLNFSIKGELRDILRHWKKRHPYRNLAITGNSIIERGITFNTDGFNFTHAIFSSYHKTNKSRLVQMVGRTCGNINYVKKINIICPTDIKNIVVEFFRMQVEVNILNPPIIQRINFIDTDKTIPVKLEFSEEVLSEIVCVRGKNLTETKKKELDILIKTRIMSNEIKFTDKNNINRFDFERYTLGSCCIYKDGHAIEKRPFTKLKKSFDESLPYSRGGYLDINENKYTLDLLDKDYDYNGEIYTKTVGWITFKK